MASTAQVISARRKGRDRLATVAINAAGGAIILLILLILVYLLYVALPLAREAHIGPAAPGSVDAAGDWVVSAEDGRLWLLAPDARATGRGEAVRASGRLALRLQGAELTLFELRERRPRGVAAAAVPVAQPLLTLPAPGVRPGSLALSNSGEDALIAYRDTAGTLHLSHLWAPLASPPQVRGSWAVEDLQLTSDVMLLDDQTRLIWIFDGARYARIDASATAVAAGAPKVSYGALFGVEDKLGIGLAGASGVGARVPRVAWGPGRETVLLFDAAGQLHRLDPARPTLPSLGPPRTLDLSPVWMLSERSRRVTALVAENGAIEVLVPSSGDRLFAGTLPDFTAPGGGELFLSDDGRYLSRLGPERIVRWHLDNPFPETGWRSLWLPHRYSAYEVPGYSWHPDGGAIGVLSKFGLTPLLFGTFKAALYGMIIAIPLSLGAAIYTGYFLPPRRRNQIKPAIEMLEAFPTVVLGFIAGLWLAPLLQDYLLLVLVLPVLFVLAPLVLGGLHLALQYLSPRFVLRPPRAMLVLGAYLLLIGLGFLLLGPVEDRFFQGSLRDWLWSALGLRYDQRNALLIGLCMGVAITPVMFSIVEDSIYAVPRRLSDGSLALGATRWQSLARVVLPAASPAILSALLIGFARGLGETMIVLLATGNTPLMEMSLFSGLRSLSASIAVELPEAGAESVQFRLLFLAALVLFGLTFVLNTIAELFRQRLRYAYASL